jgi:hypothetical protein
MGRRRNAVTARCHTATGPCYAQRSPPVEDDLIKEDPELVRNFVAASLKGFLYGRKNLDEMIAKRQKARE